MYGLKYGPEICTAACADMRYSSSRPLGPSASERRIAVNEGQGVPLRGGCGSRWLAKSPADVKRLYDPATRWEIYQPRRRAWPFANPPPFAPSWPPVFTPFEMFLPCYEE